MSDPYASAQTVLRKGFYIDHGAEFEAILILVYALFSLSIFLNIINIGVRWHRGKVWLVRIHSTTGGNFAVPNPVVAWNIFSTIFFALGLYYTHFTWLSGIVGSDLRNYIYWMVTVWIPAWVAEVCWAWSTALAPFLTPKGSLGSTRLDIRRYPRTVTAFFIITIIMSVTAIVVQGVFASRKFNQLFALFQEMDKVLTDASIAYQAGQISLLPDPAAMAAGEATFQAVFDDFVDLWIHAWIIWIVVDMIFISIFVFAVFFSWRDLRQAIKSVQGRHTASTDNQSLLWSYRTLMATSLVITIKLAAYVAIDIPLSNRPTTIKALHGERIAEVIRLWSLLAAGVLGGVINIVLSILTLRTSPSSSPRSSGDSGTVFRRAHPSQNTPPSYKSSLGSSGVQVTVELQLELEEVRDMEKEGIVRTLGNDSSGV